MVFTALGAGIASFVFRPESAVEKHDSAWLKTSSESLEKIPEHPFTTAIPLWAKPGIIATVLIIATAIWLFLGLW